METNNLVPFRAVHPLEVVKDEIKARGMTNAEFAQRLGMKPSNLSRLLKDKQDITIAWANKLESALGIDASFWLNMQAAYCKDVEAIAGRDAKENEAMEAEKMLASALNLKELYSRLKIRSSLFIHEKLERLREIYGVDPLHMPTLQMASAEAYKRSDKRETDDKNLKTWSLLALASAKNNVPPAAYIKGNAAKAASEIALKANMSKITEQDIKRILNGNGISYSVVAKLDKTPIDAYSSWWCDYPAVVTTHRYNDIDRLVFNVLHELGHIELHLAKHTNEAFIAEDNGHLHDDVKEIEANEFAENMIVPAPVWREITKAKSIGIGANDIARYLKAEAKKRNLNFGLLMWRYKFEASRYAFRGVKSTAITNPIASAY